MTPTSHSRVPCPAERVWDEIAAGLVHGDEALEMLEHASLCPECAQTLRAALEVFAPEETVPAETATPATVAIDSRAHARKPTLMKWAAIAAVLVVGAGLGYVVWQKSRSADPLALLAKAYSSHRTLDLRLPGAAWGPMRVQRGGASDLPTEAVEAELAVRKALARNPNDPRALHASGRLALLKGQPAEAIGALEAALDFGPSTPDLLIEIAIAYREKGRGSNQPADKLHAIDFLGRALQAEPNNAAALFDRAVIEDELNLMSGAIADLEKVLSVERSGPWRDEAQAMLTRLLKKRASFFNRTPGEDAGRFDEVALDQALEDLRAPAVTPLAERLRSEHKDNWLADMLTLPDTPEIRSAEDVLARMTQIRLTAEAGRYAREESDFEALTRLKLPAPLAVWRDFESLYRATHARGKFQCSATSDPLLRELASRHYPWLEVQVLRERGYCSFQAGDIDTAEQYARRSIALAETCGFPVASVRTQALPAHIGRRRGLYRDAIGLSSIALGAVILKRLPVSRSHEFYTILRGAADELGWIHSSRTAAAEMTDVAERSGFRDMQFTNMVRWAQTALRCGDARESKDLFERALAYYSTLAPNPTRAWAEIGFAEATGDDSRLRGYGAQLEQIHDSILWIPYERVQAKLAVRRGQLIEAEERAEKILAWLNSAEASQTGRSRQWYAELQGLAEIYIDLLLRQGKSVQALDFVQKYRRIQGQSAAQSTPSAAAVSKARIFSFAVAGERVAAWRLGAGMPEFRWSSLSWSEFMRLSRRWLRLVQSPLSSLEDVNRAGFEVRQALFGDWLSDLDPDVALLIQIDPIFPDLAFAALPGREEPLGLEHPLSITTLPISHHGGLLLPAEAAREFLLVNASQSNAAWLTSFPPLPSADREIASVRRAAPHAIVIEGERATTSSIARNSHEADVMHFLGHAVNTPSGVALLLPGSPTPVSLSDLRGAGFRAPPTIVLSACSTGRRTQDGNATPGSLAAALLLEGSSDVIASLWDVDSESTATFMEEFYRLVAGGSDTGAAVRGAMRFARHAPGYSHPYYWASFARFVRM